MGERRIHTEADFTARMARNFALTRQHVEAVVTQEPYDIPVGHHSHVTDVTATALFVIVGLGDEVGALESLGEHDAARELVRAAMEDLATVDRELFTVFYGDAAQKREFAQLLHKVGSDWASCSAAADRAGIEEGRRQRYRLLHRFGDAEVDIRDPMPPRNGVSGFDGLQRIAERHGISKSSANAALREQMKERRGLRIKFAV